MDYPRALCGTTQLVLQQALEYETGLNVAVWWNQTNDNTRISLWQAVPQEIYEQLVSMDHEWSRANNKMCITFPDWGTIQRRYFDNQQGE